MRIKEIIWRHRNDFKYTAECEHCGNVDTYGDGYADNFYCTQVVPNRHCADCGLNSYGRAPEQSVPSHPLAHSEASEVVTDRSADEASSVAG